MLGVEDFSVTVKEKFWQKELAKLKPEFRKALDYALSFAEGIFEGLVHVLNIKLADEGPNTFVFNISPLGVDVPMPFNLTMSRAPEFSNAKDEIILHIDGDFVSSDMSEYVPQDQTWIDYTTMEQKEELWLHQSTINTALYDLQKTLTGQGF